jgi:dipeptidyl aminopeptidase/acylaminoacyl peptidase
MLAASLLLALSVGAQTPTITESLSLKSVSSPVLSPDGKLVAYHVNETNWDDNAFETEIWVAEVATGATYQLTNAKKSSTGPQWSPDGKWLAFLSNRSDKQQLYLISPRGGEARQLTKSDTGVNSFRWAPDGKHIAFTAADPESDAMKERKKTYGEFTLEDEDYTYSHLWLVNVDPSNEKMPEPARLTEGASFTVQSFAWSPDSTRIAFSAPVNPNLNFGDTADLHLLTVANKSVKRLVDLPGSDSGPVWSPDGAQIAFTKNPVAYYLNSRIAVVPAAGGAVRILAEDFDEDIGPDDWGPRGIYFTASQRTYAHLFLLDPASGKVTQLSAPKQAVHFSFSFDRDFRNAAFLRSDATSYSEVCASALDRFTPKRLTRMGDQLKDWKLATRELIEWKSQDGTPIEGVLYKPADFDPAKKYPLLVVVHGGPTGVDRATIAADRYYPLEKFAAKGALILRPNYRGSAGYGEKFRSLNVRNLGVGDAWDVISGVDFLIAKGWVDRDRVGSMGWSQGGYISAFLTTSSDRFRAISVGAGISNWMTYYVNTDIHPFTRHYLKATPWDDPEIYAKTSPMTYINRAKTPTLIQHGEFDRRVPIPNAYELYQGLQDRGVPVRLAVYKGFGHGITKPKELRAVCQHNWEWFLQYIWNEKPEPEKPAPENPHK